MANLQNHTQTTVDPSAQAPRPRLRRVTVGCIFGFVLMINLAETAVSASERFGGERKAFSYALLPGFGAYSGSRGQFATFNFNSDLKSDDLYSSPHSLTFEYAEHIGKVSLASGITYTTVETSDELKSALGLSPVDDLTVRYLDVPMTYRVNAFTPGQSQWNLSAGLSVIMMLDISVASSAVFESASDANGVASADGSSKHVDFGFGFGGGFGFEHRLGAGVSLAAQAGFQRPFTGVTRASAGYVRFGVRWYQR